MKLESQLQQVYARFPSLKVNADKASLEAAAAKVLGAPAAKALVEALADKDTYLKARGVALDGLLKAPEGTLLRSPRTAVVSGLSSGGLMSAIVLAKAGYQVNAFEAREGYTRDIQFSSRQALIDELASIDPELSAQFLLRSAHLTKGFDFTVNGVTKHHDRALPTAGDPTRVPQTGEEMLSGVPISLIECKVLEQLLFDYAKKQPGITVHNRVTVDLGGPDADGKFSATGVPSPRKDGKSVGPPFELGSPDLVVLSEGSGTKRRAQLGITSMPTSPTERIIAGIVEKGSGGRAALRFNDKKKVDGATERILTIALGSAKLDRTWVLAEVSEDFNADPGEGLDPASPEYRAKQQGLIEKQLRHEAALVMDTDVGDDVALGGPVAGGKPTLFTLQQSMNDKATAGTNVIGLGDFVGNAHFLVGGGMATAAVSHIERLKDLVFELELGTDKSAALAKYNQGALEDTMAWGKRGISEFYPDIEPKKVTAAYVKAVNDFIAGKVKDPLAALERLLATESEALPSIGKSAA